MQTTVMRKVKAIVAMLMMISVIYTLPTVSAENGGGLPRIMVVPESIVDLNLTPGKNFTVSIYTDYNGSDITAWQFGLGYNSSVLNGGINKTETWIGDGSKKRFYLTEGPVAYDSVEVYVNGTPVTERVQGYDLWIGDGETGVFTTSKKPIVEESEEVYVNSSLQTRRTLGRDTWAGDGSTKTFYTTGQPVVQYSEMVQMNFTDTWSAGKNQRTYFTTVKPVIVYSEEVYVDGVLMIQPENYTMNYATGNITFTFTPKRRTPIKATYKALRTRDTDYTIDHATGNITFTDPPAAGTIIEAEYLYGHYTIIWDKGIISFETQVIGFPGVGAIINATYLQHHHDVDEVKGTVEFTTVNTPGVGAQIKVIYLYGGVTNGDLITGEDADFFPGAFNNTAGTLEFTGGEFFYWSGDPIPVTSGPGTLANVTFRVVGYGCSDITLGIQTKLMGWNGSNYDIIDAETMPDQIQHGFFANIEGKGNAGSNGEDAANAKGFINELVGTETGADSSWAVIMAHCTTDNVLFANSDFCSFTAQYMYHVLSEHCNFNDILYLDVHIDLPGVDYYASEANFKWAITTWLASRSDANDLIFVFTTGHGGGYNTIEQGLDEGRIDGSQGDSEDEGDEHYIDGSWVGVDECIHFDMPGLEYEQAHYWDDELKTDLDTLSYAKLVFVATECYSGGFIDDISGTNRIIMTAANETYYSFVDLDADCFNEWSEAFIDALHGQDTYWDSLNLEIVHTYNFIDADDDNNGRISMEEAWDYAWNHDTARWEVGHKEYGGLRLDETPWLDDNDNGEPTYINGVDVNAPKDDGQLASETYLPGFVLPTTLHMVVSGEDTSLSRWGPVGLMYDTAQAIKADLAKIGINLVIETTSSYTAWERISGFGWDKTYEERGWDLTLLGTRLQPHSLVPWFESMIYGNMSPPDGFNIFHYNNPAVDTVLRRGMQESDALKKKDDIWDFQSKWMHDPPWADIYNPIIYEVIASYLTGYNPSGCWWYDISQLTINSTKFYDVVADDYRRIEGPNTVVYAITEDVWNLHPTYMKTYTEEQIRCLQWNTLYKWSIKPEKWPLYLLGEEVDPLDWAIVPDIAASDPIIDPLGTGDRRRARVAIREDIDWSDGTPLTARDVEFTFNTTTLNIYSQNTGYGDFIPQLKDIEYVDEYTVDFILQYDVPMVDLKSCLANGRGGGAIMPFHKLGKYMDNPGMMKHDPSNYDLTGSSWLPVTGPFKMADWGIGDRITFVRNPLYFGYGLGWGPYNINKVILKWIEDADRRLEALQNNQVDFGEFSTGPVERFKDLADPIMHPNVRVLQYDYPASISLWFNLDHPILSNRYVRQAIAHCIDYGTLISNILPRWGIETAYRGLTPILNCHYYTDESNMTVHLYNENTDPDFPCPPFEYHAAHALKYMEMWWYAKDNEDYTKGPVGDANFNGFVDMIDYYLWIEWFGKLSHQVTFKPGQDVDPDFDNNGVIEVEDFPKWAAHYSYYYPEASITHVWSR